jgi:hypothetical protein
MTNKRANVVHRANNVNEKQRKWRRGTYFEPIRNTQPNEHHNQITSPRRQVTSRKMTPQARENTFLGD